MTLDEVIARRLSALRYLSDVPAVAHDTRTAKSKPGSRAPRQPGHPDDPWRGKDLHTYYTEKARTAPTALAKLGVLWEAEAQAHWVRHAKRRLTSEERDRAILEWGAGMPALKVAAYLECSYSHVRRLRQRHGRDPENG